MNCANWSLTDHCWLKVDKDGTWHIFPSASLTEEGGEGVVVATDRLVAGHLSVRLDAMLQTVELPAGVAHLNARLAHMNGDALTLRRQDTDTDTEA